MKLTNEYIKNIYAKNQALNILYELHGINDFYLELWNDYMDNDIEEFLDNFNIETKENLIRVVTQSENVDIEHMIKFLKLAILLYDYYKDGDEESEEDEDI